MAGLLRTPVRLRLLGGRAGAPRRPRSTALAAALLRERAAASSTGSCASEAAASGLSEPVVEDYLRHALHFELDAGDLEGLALFYRLAAEDGLIPEARPLRFV